MSSKRQLSKLDIFRKGPMRRTGEVVAEADSAGFTKDRGTQEEGLGESAWAAEQFWEG